MYRHCRRLTYYHVFPKTFPHGPPPSGAFDIDVGALKREYIEQQTRAHPDKLRARAQVPAHSTAEHSSAEISVAFKNIQNPLLRAQNILQDHGLDPLSEASTLVDRTVLADVLATRETIEAARTQAELDEVQAENAQNLARCEKELCAAFAHADWHRAAAIVASMSYYDSIQQALTAQMLNAETVNSQ